MYIITADELRVINLDVMRLETRITSIWGICDTSGHEYELGTYRTVKLCKKVLEILEEAKRQGQKQFKMPTTKEILEFEET